MLSANCSSLLCDMLSLSCGRFLQRSEIEVIVLVVVLLCLISLNWFSRVRALLIWIFPGPCVFSLENNF